jgi:hypothetical protein
MGLLDLHGTNKMLFAIHLKLYSFWPSVGVKPMSDSQVYARLINIGQVFA